MQWETPKSVFKIKSFLGLAGYYRSFIEGFSKLALPLTQLTWKGQAYVWDDKCAMSFPRVEEEVNFRAIVNFSESEGIVCGVL